MKKKHLAGIVTILLSIMSMVFITFAQADYVEWHHDKFGDYPDGTVHEWANDPVYSQFLRETGQKKSKKKNTKKKTTKKKTTKKKATKKKEYSDKYYPQMNDAWWEGRTAKWSKEGYVDYYEVALYRDGDLVTTKTVKDANSISFANNMKRGGDHEYRFEVRARNNTTNYWSPWQESEEIAVDGRDYDTSKTDSGYAVAAPSSGTPNSSLGRWVQQNKNWYYIFNKNGKAAANTWLLISNRWYYFYSNGVMATGFINLNGKKYYLGHDGSMATGNVIIDGVAHFFNSDGSMVY